MNIALVLLIHFLGPQHLFTRSNVHSAALFVSDHHHRRSAVSMQEVCCSWSRTPRSRHRTSTLPPQACKKPGSCHRLRRDKHTYTRTLGLDILKQANKAREGFLACSPRQGQVAVTRLGMLWQLQDVTMKI